MIRFEKHGRIVTMALVLSLLLGLALVALAVGHDSPDEASGYGAGLSVFQHHLHVGGSSVHHPIGMVPVAVSQLRADNYSMPTKAKREHRRRVVVPTIDNDKVGTRGEPLEVKRDTCTITTPSEDDGSRVVAADAVAFPFQPVCVTLFLADWYLPRAELLLRKAM